MTILEKRKMIEEVIAKEFDVRPGFATCKQRNRNATLPRKVLSAVLYQKEELRLIDIRDYMQYKTHCNIVYHIKTMENQYSVDRAFREKVDRVYAAAYKIYFLNEKV